jgi:hypothetical protein
MKERLDELREQYEDDSDVAEMPEEWQKEMRPETAAK